MNATAGIRAAFLTMKWVDTTQLLGTLLHEAQQEHLAMHFNVVNVSEEVLVATVTAMVRFGHFCFTSATCCFKFHKNLL